MPPSPLRVQVQATASASGAVTFRFPAVEQGGCWTGTVSIPTAPTTAAFTAQVGVPALGLVWGAWTGNATFGPVQAYGPETITVVATGLTASTIYSCTLIGQRENANDALPVSPTALATAVTSSSPTTMTAHGFMFASAATQAIANNTETTFVYGTTVWDSDTGKVGNTYVVPATLAGPWLLEVQPGWLDDAVTGATGFRECYLKSSASYLAQATYPGYTNASGAYYMWPGLRWAGILAAGAVVTATGRQTSGGALNASGGQMTNNPSLSGIYLGT